MNYQRVTIETKDSEIREILIALLEAAGYEGFEEIETGLVAYINENEFLEADLKETLGAFSLGYSLQTIPKQNWNALWESNFQPVVVADFCTVYAPFHKIEVATPFEIIITPKMSFGTGHHATTQLMMEMMKDLDFSGKSVLDFGAGTAILAILASKLGAENIVAVDHEEWAAENAIDNAAANQVKNISVVHGSLEDVPRDRYDIVLANINRHILLQYMQEMAAITKPHGMILMSGILTEDEEIIKSTAAAQGLIFQKKKQLGNWIALLFSRM